MSIQLIIAVALGGSIGSVARYLIERGQGLASLAYMLSSVVLSVLALIGALQLVRALS